MLDWLKDFWYHGEGIFLLAVIAAALLLGFMLVNAIFAVWLERKVAGRIQDRLGPTRVGGKFGWLQTLADGVKLITKEDSIPGTADQFLFRVGPYIALLGSFLAFLVLPLGNGVVAREMNIALFFMLAVMSTEVFGIILIGYGSGSKWSLFGGMREAAQMISYEIPMALCVLVPVIVAGSMNLSEVAEQQRGIWQWYVFHDPFTFIAFWTYYTCAMASCKRAPFDLAEAESELVAGFHTEYSGFRWLVIFMAEYGSMFAVSGIAILMFLGGWSTGLWFELTDLFEKTLGLGMIGTVIGNVINVTVLIFKGWFLVFVMMWVRWTLPRLRIDQVMMMCLKYLVPISCVLLAGVSIWTLVIPPFIQRYIAYVICGLSGVLAALAVVQIVMLAKLPPGNGHAGDVADDGRARLSRGSRRRPWTMAYSPFTAGTSFSTSRRKRRVLAAAGKTIHVRCANDCVRFDCGLDRPVRSRHGYHTEYRPLGDLAAVHARRRLRHLLLARRRYRRRHPAPRLCRRHPGSRRLRRHAHGSGPVHQHEDQRRGMGDLHRRRHPAFLAPLLLAPYNAPSTASRTAAAREIRSWRSSCPRMKDRRGGGRLPQDIGPQHDDRSGPDSAAPAMGRSYGRRATGQARRRPELFAAVRNRFGPLARGADWRRVSGARQTPQRSVRMTDNVNIFPYLALGALLFTCGVICMATKRNAIGVLIGVELVLNGANINFVAFSKYNAAFQVEGMVFAARFVIVMAAGEAAVALAIVLNFYNNHMTVDVDSAEELKG